MLTFVALGGPEADVNSGCPAGWLFNQLQQLTKCFASMGDGKFLFRPQLSKRLAQRRVVEIRIIAKAPGASRFVKNNAVRFPLGDAENPA